MLQPVEFEGIAIEFARSAVGFVNRIASFADMDGNVEYCVSDHHLIALKAFGAVFENGLSGNRNAVVDPLAVYYSRIANFVKEASGNSEIGFLSYNKHESKFFVRDSSAKVVYVDDRRRKCRR
jgi:hypothetical protein